MGRRVSIGNRRRASKYLDLAENGANPLHARRYLQRSISASEPKWGKSPDMRYYGRVE